MKNCEEETRLMNHRYTRIEEAAIGERFTKGEREK